MHTTKYPADTEVRETPDPPPMEVLDFFYFFNRQAERMARLARIFGFLK